jgi:hypothetical protein
MDRVYTYTEQCYVCGHVPSIGFLYECTQDFKPQVLRELLEKEPLEKGKVAGAEDGKAEDEAERDEEKHEKSSLRLRLSRAGLSESVIAAAMAGHYTKNQLDTLVEQKCELRLTIVDTQQYEIAARVAEMSFTSVSPGKDGEKSLVASDTVSGLTLQYTWKGGV